MKRARLGLIAFALSLAALLAGGHAAGDAPAPIRDTVDRVIRPLMRKDDIPGAAVGITIAGTDYFFEYGVASKQPRRLVTRDTLFEVGSVTKTFTATLASWAQIEHRLALSDPTAKYVPSLRGSPLGRVSVLNLGTHTPGGLPLQVPAGITTESQLLDYLKRWRPAYPPGTYRTYSNVGIGMLGLIAAKSWHQDFGALMERQLFPALGMTSSFLTVPATRMADYAQGYAQDGAPVRMSPGVLWLEAYGIKTTAADLVRFVEANMNLLELGRPLRRAITQAHTGYFQAGPMTQDLVWEQYPYPASLRALLGGNSPRMIFDATPVTRIKPPQEPRNRVWINKTGSTNGFGAYVAFIPEKRLGIVILANRSFPIADRVTAAYRILTSLAKE
jgi:beta-lactamase class C